MKNKIISTKTYIKAISINSGFSELYLPDIYSDIDKPGYTIISCQAALNGPGAMHCLSVISGTNFNYVTLYNGGAVVQEIHLYIMIIYKKQ